MKTYLILLLLGLVGFVLSCNHAELSPSLSNDSAREQTHSGARMGDDLEVAIADQKVLLNQEATLATVPGGVTPITMKLNWALDNNGTPTGGCDVALQINTSGSGDITILSITPPSSNSITYLDNQGNLTSQKTNRIRAMGAGYRVELVFDPTARTVKITTKVGAAVALYGGWGPSDSPFISGPASSSYASLTSYTATAAGEAAHRLTGTVIGSSGSYDGVSTRDKVFDGNINTYFDAPSANGQWVGLDLGSVKSINRIVYRPRNGWGSRMPGGKFQISNDPNFTNAVTLYTIPSSSSITFTDYEIFQKDWGASPTGPFTWAVSARYIRYLSPTNGWGNIAEIKVYQ